MLNIQSNNDNVVTLSEYQTSGVSYTSSRGDGTLHEVVVNGMTYKVETDESGNPKKLSRYSEVHKMWIAINFKGEQSEQTALSVMEVLKDSYISRVLGETA